MAVPLQTPTYADVILGALDARLANVHTAEPGRIESFNSQTQRASVQPLILRAYFDEAEVRQTERKPVIQDVPVMFPGSGTDRTTFPVKPGDLVLLVFTSCSLDRVLTQGGEVDPQDDRRHSLSDAIAIPGFYTYSSLPTTAPNDATVIHADVLKLGGPSGTKPVARSIDVENALKGALKDTTIASALFAYGSAPNPITEAALAVAVDAYFVLHSVSGSSKVESQ